MRFSKEFSRIKVIRAADPSTKPPDLGYVAELIRKTLTSEFDIYPPNLNTVITPDGSYTVTATDSNSGLNVQVSITNPSISNAQSLPAPPSQPQPPPPVNPPNTPPVPPMNQGG